MRRNSVKSIVGSLVASSALALVALTGCTGAPSATTSTSARLAAPSSTPTPTPTPTPTVFLGTGVPLGYSCDELVDPATIARVDRHLVINPAYRPDVSSSAERAVAIRGTACQWKDATTGATLIVTASHPDPPTLGDITSTTAGYATRTDIFGNDVAGYLVNTQAEVITPTGYWATASSPLFSDAAMLKIVMDSVVDALPG